LVISGAPLEGGGKALLVLNDVTERKEHQQQLEETARLADIGELAADVAHEINVPLAAILGLCQLILAEELTQKVADDIRKINWEAQRPSRVVQNLLSFARSYKPSKQYLNVTDVLGKVIEFKAYDYRVNHIHVVTRWSKDLPHTMVDENQLIQVFLNILTNAGQAMLEANGRGELVISASGSRDRVEIVIADDGPGIPPGDFRRIFDPFFTTKQVGGGTVLGLSVCNRIVRETGGEIWAESVAGKGATFHIE